jgi:hypothetical protein
MRENEKSVVIETLEKKVVDLEVQVEALNIQIVWLKEKNDELARKLFGPKSERDESDQKINEAEEIADTGEGNDIGPGGTDDAEEEKDNKSDEKKKNGGRSKLPKNLIRCVEVKDLEDKTCNCGNELKFVGDQVSEKLGVIPTKFYVEQTGALYAMVDPFYMLMLMKNLGKDFLVWDKSAEVYFRRPGRGKVFAHFHLPAEIIEQCKLHLLPGEKKDLEFWVDIFDENGEVICEVKKIIYLKRMLP